MSDELEKTEEETVYLDPMEIEVDEYNVRHDSQTDEDVIEKIKEDLENGRGIEYHITVRVKDGRYYCYVGRNRLLAAKKYVEETGRKIIIPAKIRNVDDWTALKLSLDENLKRKQLLPSEISHAVTRLYEEWKERKEKQEKDKINKKKIYMILGHDDQKIGGEKYIKNIEINRGRPEDPFAVSKFVEENDVSLKRKEVERLIAIDKLPLDIKRGLDEGYIDMLTAYELIKFSRDEQLNLYHYFYSFRMIPQVVRVEALKKYRDNRDQPFNVILIDEYRKHISDSYPIFNRLGDTQIIDIAQNIESGKLGKLAENLEYMVEEGLKPEKLKLTHIKRLISLSREELKRHSEYKRMLKIKAEHLGMRLYDEDLALAYLRDGEVALRRKKGDLNRWMNELNLSKPEDFRIKLRERSADAHDEVNRVMRFLSTHPSEYADELRNILEKGDWMALRRAIENIYSYLLKSPGYIHKEIKKRRRMRRGVLYRLYGREYSVGETLIKEGLNRNEDDVKKGIEIIIGILERIEDMLDYKLFQNLLLKLLENLPIDTEICDVNPDEYNRFSKYISLMQKIDGFLELYVYIREYISSMDEYVRNVRALEVRRLIGAYRGFMETVKAPKGEIQYSGIEKYISSVKGRDICDNVVRYINLRNEVADRLAEIEEDINSIEKSAGNEMIADQLRRKYVEHRNDFEEYTRQYYMRGLEVLKDRVEKFIEEYSRELGETLNKTITLDIERSCKYKPVILMRMTNEGLKCAILSNKDYGDKVEGIVEYMGRRYRIVLRTRFIFESVEEVSRIDT